MFPVLEAWRLIATGSSRFVASFFEPRHTVWRASVVFIIARCCFSGWRRLYVCLRLCVYRRWRWRLQRRNLCVCFFFWRYTFFYCGCWTDCFIFFTALWSIPQTTYSYNIWKIKIFELLLIEQNKWINLLEFYYHKVYEINLQLKILNSKHYCIVI